MDLYAKKVAVGELRTGMFVEALDRPWAETDFALEGVFLRTREDIDKLIDLCEYVYITTDEAPPPGDQGTIGDKVRPARNRNKPAYKDERDREPRKFKDELPQARAIRNETKVLVDTMHDDILAGRKVNTDGAQEVVTQMMDSVSRHPDALIWFTNLKNRDEYTAIHSMNVCMLSLSLATFIGADEDTVKEIGVGALLHDVGKIKIPLEVLNKPGKLTDEEYALMKKHPEFGVEILHDSPDLSPDSIDVVLSHHERMNGSGYPNKLVGRQISYYSQLVAVADVYHAMTSDRVYQKGRSPAEALKLMLGFEGDFNVELLSQFVQCIGDYPIGSLVELNTGEVGFVLPTAEKQEKPTVMLVLDQNKRRYYPQRLRDLMLFQKFTINKVHAAGAYGVDINDYAEQWE